VPVSTETSAAWPRPRAEATFARQLVDVEFIDHGASTTVVMIHSGVPESEKGDYRDGWQASFDNLDAALG
jgi:uncharacterized protein YndB with AHSA1/START domain